jgi:Periplasmic binding protein
MNRLGTRRFGVLRRSAPLAMATLMLAGTSIAMIPAAGASTSASRTVASSAPTNGNWPGVGKICGPGPGGSSTVRGVGPKTINIAVYNDAANTIEPGLEVEFLQSAKAFAAWCNASGGINGRHIVIDDRDAALFNAAQVTIQACQDDFMAVGGGMALDQASVKPRVGCGLGQITNYTVSDDAVDAALTVNPGGLNNNITSTGWYGALAKLYPQEVKHAGFGAQNNASILESQTKYKDGAEAQGWNFVDFQEPPLSVTDWTPYVQEMESKGVQALEPPDDSNIAPYVQAMDTVGFKPKFMLLGPQFYLPATTDAAAASTFPTTFVEVQVYPLELASKDPSAAELLSIMHTYAKGDAVDFNDETAINSWLLWAKSATACGSALTVSCVLTHATEVKNWSAGGLAAPIAALKAGNDNPTPTPCFAFLKVEPHKFVYDKAVTQPTSGIWNCNPKGLVHLTAQQLASA